VPVPDGSGSGSGSNSSDESRRRVGRADRPEPNEIETVKGEMHRLEGGP
jgi:hypothetical protein